MANFAPPAFGRAFVSADAAKAAKEKRKSDKEEKEDKKKEEAAKKVADSLEKGRINTEAGVKGFIDVAIQQIESGATPEQIEPSRKVVGQIIDSYVGRIAQLQGMAVQQGQDPSQFDELIQFGQQQKQLFEEAVNAAQLKREDTGEDFETLPPEEVANLGFPEGAVIQRGPDNKVTLTFDPSEDLSAFSEKVEALTPFVGEESAVGIAAGRFAVSTNPITNESVVLDLSTGEIVGEVKAPPAPEPTPAVVTPGTDPTEAVGAAGFLKNAANIITDSIGQGLAFEGTQQATTALNVIQQQTKLLMQSVVPGRPAKDVREGLKLLTVTPNSIFQGEARAKSRFEGTKRWLDNEIARIENMLQTEISPQDRGTLNANLGPLKEMSRSHQDLINAFDAEEEVDPEIEALLDKFAPVEK